MWLCWICLSNFPQNTSNDPKPLLNSAITLQHFQMLMWQPLLVFVFFNVTKALRSSSSSTEVETSQLGFRVLSIGLRAKGGDWVGCGHFDLWKTQWGAFWDARQQQSELISVYVCAAFFYIVSGWNNIAFERIICRAN